MNKTNSSIDENEEALVGEVLSDDEVREKKQAIAKWQHSPLLIQKRQQDALRLLLIPEKTKSAQKSCKFSPAWAKSMIYSIYSCAGGAS